MLNKAIRNSSHIDSLLGLKLCFKYRFVGLRSVILFQWSLGSVVSRASRRGTFPPLEGGTGGLQSCPETLTIALKEGRVMKMG